MHHKIDKGVYPAHGMARIVIRGITEHISLSDGCVPTSAALLDRMPKRFLPLLSLEDMPEGEEERKAWLLTTHAAQIAASRGYRPGTQPPLDTWIVGAPRGPPTLTGGATPLSPWFEGMPEDYRLLVHRCPLPDAATPARGRWYHLCWGLTYTRVGLEGRRHHPAPVLASAAHDLLEDVLRAYESEPSRLPRIFESTGHTYARGPTGGRIRRLSAGSSDNRIQRQDHPSAGT